MTIEKTHSHSLSPRLERALNTDNLDELREMLSTWSASELEALTAELDNAFQETMTRLHLHYLEERKQLCDDHRAQLDRCYHYLQLRSNALNYIVREVVMVALAEARGRQAS